MQRAVAVFAAPAKLHNAALHKVHGQSVASSFVSVYRFAPCGFTQQALCKIAYAGAVVVVALWPHSGAARRVLVSGLRPVITCEPLPARRGLARQCSADLAEQ